MPSHVWYPFLIWIFTYPLAPEKLNKPGANFQSFGPSAGPSDTRPLEMGGLTGEGKGILMGIYDGYHGIYYGYHGIYYGYHGIYYGYHGIYYGYHGIYYGYHRIYLPTKYSQKGKTIEQKVASWRRTWGMIEFGAATWTLLGSWLRMNKLHRLFWLLFIRQSANIAQYIDCIANAVFCLCVPRMVTRSMPEPEKLQFGSITWPWLDVDLRVKNIANKREGTFYPHRSWKSRNKIVGIHSGKHWLILDGHPCRGRDWTFCRLKAALLDMWHLQFSDCKFSQTNSPVLISITPCYTLGKTKPFLVAAMDSPLWRLR